MQAVTGGWGARAFAPSPPMTATAAGRRSP